MNTSVQTNVNSVVAEKFVSQVFWPISCTLSRPGYLIGWNIRHFMCSVVTVVSADAVDSLEHLEQLLAIFARKSHTSKILNQCSGSGAPPVVLGEWRGEGEGEVAGARSAGEQRSHVLQLRRKTANIWLTMQLERGNNASDGGEGACTAGGRPTLHTIHCCGRLRRTACHVVFYEHVEPSSFQYFSTRPYLHSLHDSVASSAGGVSGAPTLHATRKTNASVGSGGAKGATTDADAGVGTDSSIGSSDGVISQGVSNVVTTTGSSSDSSGNGPTDMDYVARQINAASMLEQRLLSTITGNVCVAGAATPTAVNSTVSNMVPESKGLHPRNSTRANDGRTEQDPGPQNGTAARLDTTDAESGKAIQALYMIGLHLPITCWHYCAGLTVWFGGLRFPKFVPELGSRRLVDVSLLFQVLDLRAREICRWPERYREVRARVEDPYANISPAAQLSLGVEYLHAPCVAYTALLNAWCRVLLDVVLGWVICVVLVLNSAAQGEGGHILRLVHRFFEYLHVDVLREQIKWLMGMPGGFKLNAQLNTQLGAALLGALRAWNSFTTILTPLEPFIVVCLGLSGLLGCTVFLALASDLLSVVTMHVYLIFRIFSGIHNFQLRLLSSMWKLFRGKKRNVLRNRVDSCEADTNQLLLGTLVFTMSVFLFTTFFVYYVFFLLVWVLVLIVQSQLWLLFVAIDACPAYSAVQLLMAPERFPSGIHIDLDKQHREVNSSSNAARDLDPQSPRTLHCKTSSEARHLSASPSRASPTQLPRNKSNLHAFARRPQHLVEGSRRSFSFENLSRSFSFENLSTDLFGRNESSLEHDMGGADRSNNVHVTYLKLRSVAAPFGALFYEYSRYISVLSSHFRLGMLLRGLFLGANVPSCNAHWRVKRHFCESCTADLPHLDVCRRWVNETPEPMKRKLLRASLSLFLLCSVFACWLVQRKLS